MTVDATTTRFTSSLAVGRLKPGNGCKRGYRSITGHPEQTPKTIAITVTVANILPNEN
jgi:hypothetical protein